jgi:DNA topoisomerase IB
MAIAAFVRTPLPKKRGDRMIASAQMQAVRQVAAALGNTPAVCRSSYIHPAVFAGWRNRRLQRSMSPADLASPRKLERATLNFLREYSPDR